ncbi:hypothetical protein Tco_0189332 [Tanacetum coccineum]
MTRRAGGSLSTLAPKMGLGKSSWGLATKCDQPGHVLLIARAEAVNPVQASMVDGAMLVMIAMVSVVCSMISEVNLRLTEWTELYMGNSANAVIKGEGVCYFEDDTSEKESS